MARDGSGNYSLPEADFVSGTTIDETAMNSNLGDIETALTNSIAKNGETTVTGNIKMGSKKLTGLTTGSANGDSLSLGQAQNQGYIYAVSSGTDTVTLSLSPAVTAYAAGQTFRFKAGGTNTGAATLNVNSVGAKAIQNRGSALLANEITANYFYEATYDGTQFQLNELRVAPASLADNFLTGLTISNGTTTATDINIADGSCMDSTNAEQMTLSGGPLVKELDNAWAAGSASGGRIAAAEGTSTWYHVFIIKHSNGTVDAGFDTSLTASTLLSESGYTYYRRIGSIYNDSSGDIELFTQKGNFFLWDDPPLDVNTSTLSTTSTSYTLSVPPVDGITAQMNINATHASGASVYIRDLNADDEAPGGSAPLSNILAGTTTQSSKMEIHTNSSGQIAARSGASSTTLKIATLGWYDRLGRDW